MTKHSIQDSAYQLHHWNLSRIHEGITAVGSLCGPQGSPEGIRIRTSVIQKWQIGTDEIILYTINSVYRCPIREYADTGGTISLLEEIQHL